MHFGAALIDTHTCRHKPCILGLLSLTHAPPSTFLVTLSPTLIPIPPPHTPTHKHAPTPTPTPLHAQALNVARTAFSAHGAEHARWRALVLATGTAGSVQHAAGEFDAAADSFESLLDMLEQFCPRE